MWLNEVKISLKKCGNSAARGAQSEYHCDRLA